MNTVRQAARGVIGMLALATATACTNGQLGNILSGVLSPTTGTATAAGTVQGVDTRNQIITIQQGNGQTIGVSYDNNTQVVYQNQNYPVTSLQYGDQISAQVQSTNNGGYYTSLVQVTQAVSSNTNPNGSSANVQQFAGQVQQVNVANGWFTMSTNGTQFTVLMPYNPSYADQQRFQNLRVGDYVTIYGAFLNNTQVQLRQFR